MTKKFIDLEKHRREQAQQKRRTWYQSRCDDDYSAEIWYELHDITDCEGSIGHQSSFIKFMGIRAKNDCDFYVAQLRKRGDEVI